MRYQPSTTGVIALSFLLIVLGAPSVAYTSDRGELLYQNHCQTCHDKSVHERIDSRVTSPESLRAWVMAWSIHNGFFWGAEEVADLTAYLNRTIYHYTE
jgi:mono/diheme cytochrome c family protein